MFANDSFLIIIIENNRSDDHILIDTRNFLKHMEQSRLIEDVSLETNEDSLIYEEKVRSPSNKLELREKILLGVS